MIAVDTNVLLRFLVDDDPLQSAKARDFMTERSSEDPAYISAEVLAETIWFPTQRLGYQKSQIIDMLQSLVRVVEIVVEHSTELEFVLNDSPSSIGDIADHLIGWSAHRAGCRKIVTFDKKAAARVPGMELLA